MADMAKQEKDKPVCLSEISTRQKISLSYLEQLFGKLRKKNLVISIRGPGGGYKLARSASDISLAEIMSAVEEKMDTTQCGGRENCNGEDRCLTHDLWTGLNEKIFSYLNNINLGNLINPQPSNLSGGNLVSDRTGKVFNKVNFSRHN